MTVQRHHELIHRRALDRPKRGKIKCVVWDLDDTLWNGVLMEDPSVRPNPEVVDEIVRLDRLGILHSIASRNDYDLAMDRLREARLDTFFLHPQINWNPKSQSIETIANTLNIGLDAVAFVDDQPFERDEVNHALPAVTTIDAAHVSWSRDSVLRAAEFSPRFVTEESARRRLMYRAETQRSRAQAEYTGTDKEFLALLNMRLTITRATEDDLKRAEELTVRTNQLNSTGRTYSYAELETLRTSSDHLVLVARLDDVYGQYGTIGLALVERGRDTWRLALLLMSCRVIARGVGTVLLHQIMSMAKAGGADLVAELVHTGRNRMMKITYAMAGFNSIAHHVDEDGRLHELLHHDLAEVPPPPDFLTVEAQR